MNPANKLEDLKKRIAEKGKLLVAYSGGVDSSLLARVAHDVLGGNALAVILDSIVMPRSELEGAKEQARS
ncbi:MAG: TIGR00268 family protein, partial [Methanothrix sp.]|nr:TIGR00268 family protein [Methanothrix sp.]